MFEGTDSVLNNESVPSNISYKFFKVSVVKSTNQKENKEGYLSLICCRLSKQLSPREEKKMVKHYRFLFHL